MFWETFAKVCRVFGKHSILDVLERCESDSEIWRFMQAGKKEYLYFDVAIWLVLEDLGKFSKEMVHGKLNFLFSDSHSEKFHKIPTKIPVMAFFFN